MKGMREWVKMKGMREWVKTQIGSSLVASFIWAVIIWYGNTILNWLGFAVWLSEERLKWFRLIISTLLVFIFLSQRFYHKRSSSPTHQYMRELNQILKKGHSGVKPLLAFIANNSAKQLFSPPEGKEAQVTFNQYVGLLEESIKNKDLVDVTFFLSVAPSKLGNGEVNRSAMEYFNIQAKIKQENNKIRMRRVLTISKDAFIKDLENEFTIKFKKMHEKAKIDLFCLPITQIKKDNKRYLLDQAVFWTKKGTCWVLRSNLDEDKITSDRVSVKLIHDTINIQYMNDFLLNEVLGTAIKTYADADGSCNYIARLDESNMPSTNFKKKYGLS